MADKILMIDDDKDFVEAVKFILEEKGYEFVFSNDPKEGYEKIKMEKPNLIILDVMMERKASGFILSRKIRKDPEIPGGSKVPIIMLTGMRESTGFFLPGETKDEHFLPIDEFMEKPVKADELIKTIEKLLGKK